MKVVVVGGGNAAFAAAVAAREGGAQVTVLERAPVALSGGNSRFTAGAMRFAYSRGSSPGRCSTPRPATCCATSTGSARSPR